MLKYSVLQGPKPVELKTNNSSEPMIAILRSRWMPPQNQNAYRARVHNVANGTNPQYRKSGNKDGEEQAQGVAIWKGDRCMRTQAEQLDFMNDKSASPTERSKKAKHNESAIKLQEIYRASKKKLTELFPAVFKNDVDLENYIFELFCGKRSMNNSMDTCDDMFAMAEAMADEQRVPRALDSFSSIQENVSNIVDALNENCMTFYDSQFKELSEIGSGGFGKVFKAKHLLDETIYAVKKVYIKQQRTEEINQALDEVKILARLNHPNVVGYKHAWIEPYNGTDLPFSESSQSCSQTDSSNTQNDVEFSNMHCSKSNRSDVNHATSQSSQDKEPRIILYIQMCLCKQNLREWMSDRNGQYSSSEEIEIIMTQMLSGLDYIHSRGIIHHDIKPQNIFISVESEKIVVQLGDFGLACKCPKDEHSEKIGTNMYAAPEQLEKKCDSKSDVYSCGIILFELLYPMQTDMERSKEIENLKNGKLPTKGEERYQEWVPIFNRTLSMNPTYRSTAGELVYFLLRSEDSLEMAELQERIAALEEENDVMRNIIETTTGTVWNQNQIFPWAE